MNRNGRIAGRVWNFRDVSKRKETERENEQFLKTLALKNEELESILSIASHDLRSPLVNIQGFCHELKDCCELLNVKLTENLDASVRKALQKRIPEAFEYITTSVNKIDQLLTGLLKLSRLGLAAVEIEKLDINLMIAEILNSLEYQIKEKNIDVQVDNLMPCYGDSSQINQVFSNLIHNSLKFIDESRPGNVYIYSEKKGENIVYCIKDNGIGIEQKDHDKIFEIFHQIKPDLKRGQGLGLSIVKRIVDRHDGEVFVESHVGQGSSFFVSLPGI